MELKDFFKEYCKNCKEKCERGLIEKQDFIRCIDRDIFVKKESINKNK